MTLIRTPLFVAGAVAAALTFTGPVVAQDRTGQAANGQQAKAAQGDKTFDVIRLSNWRYDELYADGWSAKRLIDAAVYGPNGDEIGEVENILVKEDGSVVAVIAEIGGFWDIGDTHVAVPWENVKVESYDRVNIPVTEDSVEKYSVFNFIGTVEQSTRVSEDANILPPVWKVSELLHDYVALKDNAGYGYVSDLIFGKDAKIKSVVVNPTTGYGRYGPYAYPYYGYNRARNPGMDIYRLPYTKAEVTKAELFDYNKMNEGVFGDS